MNVRQTGFSYHKENKVYKLSQIDTFTQCNNAPKTYMQVCSPKALASCAGSKPLIYTYVVTHKFVEASSTSS